MKQDIRDATRLLVVDPDIEEANRLVNIFRDAGQATRAEHVTSLDDLENAFLKKHKWDLLIISRLPETLTLSALLASIAHQYRDIPTFFITEYKNWDEKLEYLKTGVTNVVPPGNESMLLLLANREIESLYVRRNYRRMSVALYESEKQRRLLLDDRVDPIVYISGGIIRYANPAFYDLVRMEEGGSLLGKPFTEFVTGADQEDVANFLQGIEDSGQAISALQCALVLEDGAGEAIRALIKPTSFDGLFTLSLQIKPLNKKSTFVHKKTSDRVSAFLTKKELVEQLEINLQKVVSGQEQSTLIHATIDGLKAIHDQEGSLVSNRLEKAVEKVIAEVLGTRHMGVCLGGGQFLMLLGIGCETEVQEIARLLLQQITAQPFEVKDKSFQLSLSLGAIILCDTGKDARTLMVRARHACSQAEKDGGGRLAFYRERRVDVVKTVEKHIAMMLSQAMKTNAMRLYYQPVVSLKGSTSDHYDVLFTMTDIRGREHSATAFRPRLDNLPLWGRVDRWQLMASAQALATKRQAGGDTRLLFHLGGYVINDPRFLPWLTQALASAGVPASAITLELSETNVVRYGAEAARFFAAVKKLGAATAISEFGCSITPLKTIDAMDVDFIKVDPSFTRELVRDGQEGAEELTEVLAALLKKDRKVIVPDVQNTKTLALLWHTGIDYVQGNFLQGPTGAMDYNFDTSLSI